MSSASARLLHRLNSSLKSTLLLPTTPFPIHPAADHLRANLLKKCTADLYAAQRRDPARTEAFILHDGPPYANGDLHLGHALNKVLKDIINRVAILDGKKVDYVPGWDCHGLPIELKALQALGPGSSGLSPLEVRAAARALANETIERQKELFQKWGVLGDWDGAYRTMDTSYELRQLDVFKNMVERGLIYRRFRPVFWSPKSETALAEAELEYNEKHVSKAAIVRFPILGGLDGEEVAAAVWTTTPWTLTANKAVGIGEDMEYVIVQTDKHGKLLIARERIPWLEGLLGEGLQDSITKERLFHTELAGKQYVHPLFPSNGPSPIVLAEFTTNDSGTGLVHLAPGHGMEDYLVCLRHGLPPFSPVSDDGRFTGDAGLPSLTRLEVLYAGTKEMLALLESHGALVDVHEFTHKYPYDWRSKTPVIVRSTAQWFADVSALQEPAISSLASVTFHPKSGHSRLAGCVKARTEWCISRQRAWGVPIPALYAPDGSALLTPSSISHISSIFAKHGTDSWFSPEVPTSLFTPPDASAAVDYTRKPETLDVWFDSGSSWALLPKAVQADMCLEGTDQSRGWFQSSLLTSFATRSRPPFRTVITHGFVLDAKGKKMSKSLGNVVAPDSLPSAEHLRLWVASTNFTRDVNVGPKVLAQNVKTLRKARVTLRFLLAAAADSDGREVVIRRVDRMPLLALCQISDAVKQSYRNHAFHAAIAQLSLFAMNLSAGYLDAVKDRLYALPLQDPARRSAVAACRVLLDGLTELWRPILPVLCEEVDESRGVQNGGLGWLLVDEEWNNEDFRKEADVIDNVKTAVRAAVERARADGRVKASLETRVIISGGGDIVKRWVDDGEMEEWLIVSHAKMASNDPERDPGWEELEEFEGGEVLVKKAKGKKCVRCWLWKAQKEGGVCDRCETVLEAMEGDGRFVS